ncbi:MAG: band-7 C-terminal domain-containing protein, partial [Caulobacterales bacterium]
RLAGAEAQATKVVSDAIESGSVNALNYFVAQRYTDAFAKLAESNQQRTVIIPADFAGIAGSIAGITELVRSAQGPVAGGPTAAPRTPPAPRPPAGS